MRVALCLSGHIRTFDETFGTLYKNIISKTNCDIYLHTWEQTGILFDGEGFDEPVDQNYLKQIVSLYKLEFKNTVIEPQKEFIDKYNNKRNFKQGNIGVMSMFYKIKMAHEMTKSENYDVIIRCRPDLITSELNLKELEDLENVYVPDLMLPLYIGDMFAFSSAKNMELYSRTFDHMDELYPLNTCDHPAHRGLHPETLLKLNCDKYGLKIKKSSIKVGILRFNGEISRY